MKPWVIATGSPATRERKAAHYLKVFNHDTPFRREMPEFTLAKVVCNLRNFYQQDAEMTVKLVQSLYNDKSGYAWTSEGIRLAWELSEGYAPSLGLADEKAIAKQWAALLREEVAHLLGWVKPGGRTLDKDLLKVFREWNPDIEVTSNAFTRAVQAVTGMCKTPSNSCRYWDGFHIPTADELEPSEITAA